VDGSPSNQKPTLPKKKREQDTEEEIQHGHNITLFFPRTNLSIYQLDHVFISICPGGYHVEQDVDPTQGFQGGGVLKKGGIDM
jgi:hypothetical protein